MATHPDFQFDLTDWTPCDDSLPQQGEAQHSIGVLKAQVQVLQAEVAVLQRCLHDSIDLQKGILDHLIQQGGTVPFTPQPVPLANSTPYSAAQVASTASRSVPVSVAYSNAPIFTHPLALDMNTTTKALLCFINHGLNRPCFLQMAP